MRALLYLLSLLVFVACGPRAGGFVVGDASAVDGADVSADVMPVAPRWDGTYDARITATLAGRSTTGTDVVVIDENGIGRATWQRSGMCFTLWSLDGSRSRADAGQRCTVDVSGTPTTIELLDGSATIAADVVTATFRWSTPGGELVESITARRRP